MRPFRGRTKKLIIAFHFFRSNPAGWKCGTCRENRLEERRRCGFIARHPSGPERIVWARGGKALTVCPVSFVTPESIALLEEFSARKVLSLDGDLLNMPARTVDGLQILESELLGEMNNDKR